MKSILIIFIAFLPTIVMADDLYTNDIIGGCGDVYSYSAEFELISYTCSSGQYLPAGAISCEACPDGYTCSGGTFSFNANQTQGLDKGDILITDAIGSCSPAFTQNYGAIFEPITYTCLPGYYLPAGNDWTTDDQGCTICPNDNYCPGGTYTFNETTTQGITPCPVEHPFAPVGMWLSSQCGRKLHIGDDVIYMHQTPANPSEHRLFIKIVNDIYSANMSAKTNGVQPMSINANRSLNVMFNGIEYFVHDDSIKN